MKHTIIILAILALLLAGCAQKSPDIVCSSPYIRHAASCCIDRNANNVCDDDEEEKPLFVEPDYAAREVPDVTAAPEPAQQEIQPESQDEPVYEVTSPTGEKTTATYIGEKDTVSTVPTKYDAAVPKLQDWKVENEHMSLEITKIVIDVNDIEKTDLKSPDKEAYLKEIYLIVKNKDYPYYMNPEFLFKLGDSKDPLVLVKTMHCDRFDPILMEGCLNALPETETMQIKMVIDERIPRINLGLNLKLTLQNRRDEDDKNILKLEKTFNMLDLYGATYI